MANLQRIKELAELKGISIRDLANQVGLGENRIHVMCRTNSTKIETLEKIASVLEVSVKVFFDDEVTYREEYHAHGEKGIVAKRVDYIDQRSTEIPVDDSSTIAELREQIALLKSQLEDKERIIRLMEERR